MHVKIFSGLVMTMLLFAISIQASNVPRLEASETIFIKPDGSIDPPAAPISREGDIYTFNDSVRDSIVVQRSNIVIDGSGHTVEGTTTGAGMSLSIVENVTVLNMTIKTFDTGIFLDGCSGCNITQTNITLSYSNGIHVVGSSKNTVAKNSISSNRNFGILLTGASSGNTMSENSITGSGHDGISLSSSSNNIMDNNTLASNGNGFYLLASSNNTISGNEVAGNTVGILVSWSSTDNRITGNNLTENENCVLLDSASHNAVVRNYMEKSGSQSVWLSYYSSYNNVTENYVAGSGLDGVFLSNSSRNTISGNKITNSTKAGVFIDNSSNNDIVENNITQCVEGISLNKSSNNYLLGNDIGNNQIGVRFDGSTNNSVYHNNFMANTNQVHIQDSTTVWDDGYFSGGNYWSNYNGTDRYCGEEQSLDGSDMIGDTPYAIDATNRDRYPLAEPWPVPIHIFGFQNGSVMAISASSMTNFVFDKDLGEIRFNLASNTPDSCRVIVSKRLLDGAFNFLVDNVPAACSISWNLEYHIMNFTYAEGIHNVRIIGEYADRPPMREFPDLNGDGIIDIYDAIILAGSYGKTKP